MTMVERPVCFTFMGGLDDGPWLPGKGPRKRPKKKSALELRIIRLRAWETRRAHTALSTPEGE